jgi:hypothetical protein
MAMWQWDNNALRECDINAKLHECNLAMTQQSNNTAMHHYSLAAMH